MEMDLQQLLIILLKLVLKVRCKLSLDLQLESETVKTLLTHYTISKNVGNAGGGAVTFQSGHIPASGETVILRRVTAQTQAMDLIDNDPMSADTIETAHDKSIAITQELQEQLIDL